MFFAHLIAITQAVLTLGKVLNFEPTIHQLNNLGLVRVLNQLNGKHAVFDLKVWNECILVNTTENLT